MFYYLFILGTTLLTTHHRNIGVWPVKFNDAQKTQTNSETFQKNVCFKNRYEPMIVHKCTLKKLYCALYLREENNWTN